MCRLLCVKAVRPFRVKEYFAGFSELARLSSEYQGHGWGFAWRDADRWQMYHNLKPIWEDSEPPDVKTTVLLAHARSAFEDRDIAVENNMPFSDGRLAFVFNGELRGVRIKIDGRIGAEKLFNLIRSRENGNLLQAVSDSMKLLQQRTTFLKAANLLLSDGENVYVASKFNQDPEYYTMWRTKTPDGLIACSERFGEFDWGPIPQGVARLA